MTFNILDVFGHEHREEAETEALKQLGHANCDARAVIYEDHANLALHAECATCGWREVLDPMIVERIAAPIRRRLARERSPVAQQARNTQLAENAHLN